ncbi:hypothetical protein CBS101457_006830 [Exobasidium rhododendri]|nr:hypothetical protein CBS101457_006830 [Exobasidium rhododendri]
MADSTDPRIFKTVTAPSLDVFKADIFKGKVLFCTGGGSGICKGMTQQIMKHGAHAAIVGRKADRLTAAAKSLEEGARNGTRCIATPGDVRKFEDLQAAVKKTLDTYGRIDFVICGAAGNFLAPIEGVSPNGFATVQQIDLQGTYNTVKATLAEMKRTHGVYIHISATLHYTGIPWQAAASAAKAGIDALSQSIAVEMGPFGIRSNVIAPGIISGTEGSDRLTPKGSESLIESRIPAQRTGIIDDISNMGVYLFSNAAAYISGAKFVVDGGAQHFPGPWLPYPMSSLDPQDLKELITGSKL